MNGATMFRLDNETALVTGSSRGLGSFIARGLAEAGARVIIHGTNLEGAEATAAALTGDGLNATAAAFDVSDAEAVAEGVAALAAQGDVPSILVNNAGINIRKPMVEFGDDDWHRIMGIHLDGAYYLAKACVPAMLKAGHGKIINMCSLTSEVARPNISAYATAKGGLKMMTRAMASEWAAKGINCNGIAPGFFATDMNQPLIDDPEFNAWVKKRTPAGRWGEPADIAGAAIFLASPAAAYVNGHMLAVDGGFLGSM